MYGGVVGIEAGVRGGDRRLKFNVCVSRGLYFNFIFSVGALAKSVCEGGPRGSGMSSNVSKISIFFPHQPKCFQP